MKLASLPSRDDLKLAYETLEFSKSDDQLDRKEFFADFITWTQFTRLDARLAQIIVGFLSRNFRRVNPFTLWKLNRVAGAPQALAVLIDFASDRVEQDFKAEFKAWRNAVLYQMQPTNPQFFFVRDGFPKPAKDLSEIKRSLRHYTNWGFFGTEQLAVFKSDAAQESRTRLASAQRLMILNELLKTKASLTVNEYMRACSLAVSRRTAERDLAACAKLKSTGHTGSVRFCVSGYLVNELPNCFFDLVSLRAS